MKRLVSLTLLVFVLISSSSVYARSIDTEIQKFMDSPAPDFSELSKANGSKIINEFDAIIEKEIISELRYSYSDKHDETLYFKQEIINLSNNSRNELEKMNFNDRQVDAILSTKGLSADKVSNDVARRALNMEITQLLMLIGHGSLLQFRRGKILSFLDLVMDLQLI